MLPRSTPRILQRQLGGRCTLFFRNKFSIRLRYQREHTLNGPFDPPYHANQYLETYFLYEYPKSDEITADQKTIYKAIYVTLKLLC